MKKYIDKINSLYQEIKEIKSEKCIMDYDAKTEIINLKMKSIASIESDISLISMSGNAFGGVIDG